MVKDLENIEADLKSKVDKPLMNASDSSFNQGFNQGSRFGLVTKIMKEPFTFRLSMKLY